MMIPQAPKLEKTLEQRLAEVRLLVMEMEGVLTDGSIYTDSQGRVSIRTRRVDELGLAFWRQQGNLVLVLARQGFEPARAWASAADLELCTYQGNKDLALQTTALELGILPNQVCYLGCDLDDLPAMSLVGLAAATADADPWAKGAAHLVLRHSCGAGAVRELVDTILNERLPTGHQE
ncbi:Phenylphosphate carboxylase subunit delta [Desulfarculales bacterium]